MAAGSLIGQVEGQTGTRPTGNEHAGKTVCILIHDLDVIIIDRVTGEILRELRIDSDRYPKK